jgi:peroxiredoxin Q/BCP
MYGKKYMGIQRATFVLDANGYVMKVFPKVTPEGHSKELLKIFK